MKKHVWGGKCQNNLISIFFRPREEHRVQCDEMCYYSGGVHWYGNGFPISPNDQKWRHAKKENGYELKKWEYLLHFVGNCLNKHPHSIYKSYSFKLNEIYAQSTRALQA